MQAECRKILKNLKDGKSKFQQLKDSCNTGMWLAGGIASLCLVVVGLAAAHVCFAPAASVTAVGTGCVAAVGAIGAFIGKDYYRNKIAKTDEVIGQISKDEELVI